MKNGVATKRQPTVSISRFCGSTKKWHAVPTRTELRWSRYSIQLLRLPKDLLLAIGYDDTDGRIAATDPDIARERVCINRLARMLRDDTPERCRTALRKMTHYVPAAGGRHLFRRRTS